VQNNRIAKLNRNKQVFHSKIHMGGTTDATSGFTRDQQSLILFRGIGAGGHYPLLAKKLNKRRF
jgi:hypothetical protein